MSEFHNSKLFFTSRSTKICILSFALMNMHFWGLKEQNTGWYLYKLIHYTGGAVQFTKPESLYRNRRCDTLFVSLVNLDLYVRNIKCHVFKSMSHHFDFLNASCKNIGQNRSLKFLFTKERN